MKNGQIGIQIVDMEMRTPGNHFLRKTDSIVGFELIMNCLLVPNYLSYGGLSNIPQMLRYGECTSP